MPIAAGLHYFLHEGGKAGAKPLVLLHGAGADHLFWPAEIRRLPEANVFTLDLPGHGRSKGPGLQSIADYARAVIAFLDAAGLWRCVLAGHGMGGAIALSLAIEHPDRVAGLALIASGARLPVTPSVLENAANSSTFPLAVREIHEASFGSGADATLRDQILARRSAVRPTLLQGDLLACDRFDVSDRLDAVRVPVLTVCGAEDRLTPLRYSETLSRQIPGAALQTIDGVGHMVMLEQPRRVASLLKVFLATIPEAAG